MIIGYSVKPAGLMIPVAGFTILYSGNLDCRAGSYFVFKHGYTIDYSSS